jgi:diadenosine tetraphosphate (Ap4A) HIT family hydrolase
VPAGQGGIMADSDCPFCQKLARLHELSPEEVVWQFPHSVALLGLWQYYQGYCILVARRHATELSQLRAGVCGEYLEEMCRLAHAIEDAFRPRKLNYELLGNQVPHLHWHLFPRSASDPEALHPVWRALERAERDPAERSRLQAAEVSRAETSAQIRNSLRTLMTSLI